MNPPPNHRRPAIIGAGVVFCLLALLHFTRPSLENSLPSAKQPLPGSPTALDPPASFPLDQVALEIVPLTRDRDELIAEALERSERKRVHRFATPIDVSINPSANGTWDRTPDGRLRWRLHIHSPEATSLNFGFTRYEMPEGGALRLTTPGAPSPFRDFTDADNEAHGQLWTPILQGSTATIEVELPPGASPGSLGLELTRVNHGFRGWFPPAYELLLGDDISKPCQLDVICSGTDTGSTPFIENYRDQIRSVGVYTHLGQDTCCGAVLNNTAEDGTPYFLTAEHCDVYSSNSASLVVYWNFENSTCREPGSAASGSLGDGPLTQFNSGSYFRSSHVPSDFNLLELDDPIDPAHGVFYAGWNRSTADFPMAVGIHHPNNAEKRINFEFDPTTTTSLFSNTPLAGGHFIRVAHWDIGVNEVGSSGGPLFDDNGRIVGQLIGGDDSCTGVNTSWYGRFSKSWDGGGTSATRLSDWLDPLAAAPVTLDGRDFDALVSADDITVVEGDSGTVLAEFTITLDSPLTVAASVDYATMNGTAAGGTDFVSTSGQVNFAIGETSKPVFITVNGDTDTEDHETFTIVLSNSSNAAIGDGVGLCEIRNDDFILPVITSPLTDSGRVGDPFTYTITADNTPESFGLSGSVPAGMTVNPATGAVAWTPTLAGNHPVDIVATNPAGDGVETLVIAVAEHPVLVGIDQNPFGRIVTESATPWSLVASPAQDATDAAQSGAIIHSESTWFEMTVTGPDTVLFHWKVSSQPDSDFLNFYIDGALRKRISGNIDWRRESFAIPAGPHTLRWEYAKDAFFGGGLDRGWVDQVVFVSDFPYPLLTSSLAPCSVLGGIDVYECLTSRPADSITITGLPPGLVADPDGVVRGTAATGTYPLTVTASNAFGSDVQTVNLEIVPALGIAAALDINTLDLAAATTTTDPWFSQSSTTHDGVDAAQAADIGHYETTAFKVHAIGPGTVSFRWKAATEQDFDLLNFYIDGLKVDTLSGDTAWILATHDLGPGLHELTWSYEKDDDISSPLDTGWVDQLTFTGYAHWIASSNVNGRAALHIDAEHDGFTNLEEYYLDQGALTAEPHDVPALSLVGGNYRLTLPRRATATDVLGTVEISTDLLNWSTANTSILTDTPTSLVVEETFSAPKPPAVHFRLHLSPQ